MERRTRRSYTPEFKEQAIQLALDLNSVAQAEKELGLPKGLIRQWRAKGIGSRLSLGAGQNPASVEEELRRLRKENEQLKKINHILKSAAAFFSQDHLK